LIKVTSTGSTNDVQRYTLAFSEGVPVARTLTLTATTVANVPVTVSPADNNGTVSATTTGTLSFPNGQEVTITGQSNHAGTTPMRLRHDAGFAAAAIASFVRTLATEMGGAQVGTVGAITLHPNLINVIAARAQLTVDLRNTDEAKLQEAERRLAAFLSDLAEREGVGIETRRLARFEPVKFDQGVVATIEETAATLGYSQRRMTSGAGHDAQMLARICPTAMIFTPSVKGLSHNPAEYTAPADLAAGANVLLHTLLRLAG
jgi:N-carbamoyl-L-amino-acid hydrolase